MRTKVFVSMIFALIIFAGCGNKKSEVSSRVSDPTLKTPEPDYGMMIVATLTVKPEKIKDFTEAAKEMIEKSNKESGCKLYQLYQDPYDNTKFVFVEQYTNQAAIDQHFAADYFKAFGPKISDIVAGPAKIKIITMAKEVIQ